ncbi:hypothetical protein EV121DRAFT_297979 [Schizophyllum commune]
MAQSNCRRYRHRAARPTACPVRHASSNDAASTRRPAPTPTPSSTRTCHARFARTVACTLSAHAVALARADRRVTWQCHVMRVNRANAWAAGRAHLDAHDRRRWVFRPSHMSTPRYAAGSQSRTTATWRVDRILAMSGSAGLRLREAVAFRGRPAPQHGADAQARKTVGGPGCPRATRRSARARFAL